MTARPINFQHVEGEWLGLPISKTVPQHTPSIMRTYWSDELRIMLRPASTYRQLSKAADDSGVWILIRRPLFVTLVVGSFVSITVSGHLTISLLFDGMIFWSFVPILQGILMSGIVVIFGRRRFPTSKAMDLFFMGHGPWLMWLLAIAATCLFFPVKQFYLWPNSMGMGIAR